MDRRKGVATWVVRLVAALEEAGKVEVQELLIVQSLAQDLGAGVGVLLRTDVLHRDLRLTGQYPVAAIALGEAVRRFLLDGPLLLPLLTGDMTPRSAERAYGNPAWTHAPARRALRRAWGSDHLATLPLAGPPRPTVVLLGRQGPDFSDSELTRLARLQPSLGALARLVHLTSGGSERAAGHGERAPAPDRTSPFPGVGSVAGSEHRALSPLSVPSVGRLTGRELEVLALLARGHKAATIARLAGCSPRTVHRHLSSIYRKLGVPDRLSAVNRAHLLGLLALPTGHPRDTPAPVLVAEPLPDGA